MVDDTLTTSGHVRVAAYDIDPDEWYSSDDKESLLDREPDEVSENSNITCIGMHSSISDAINPESTFTDHPQYVAVGEGNEDPQYENTELNDEVYRKTIGEYDAGDTYLHCSTRFEPHQAGNVDIVEVGLFSLAGGGVLWNHSVIEPIERTGQRVIAIDVELTFEPQ